MASSQHPQSRQANDGVFLPRDVLGEILLRVPARPLCRLRAVCRSWRSLLTDGHFVAAHGARHPGPLLAVCVGRFLQVVLDEDVVSVKFLDTSGCIVKQIPVGPSYMASLVQPHLGLVLVWLTTRWSFPLRVLDPATGTVTFLPYDAHHLGFAGDHSFVLGRAAAGVYKVLSLSRGSSTPRASLVYKILTLGGAWRNAPAPRPPASVQTLTYNVAVAANRVIYCICIAHHRERRFEIAAFDLTAEQWRPDLLRGLLPDDKDTRNCILASASWAK